MFGQLYKWAMARYCASSRRSILPTRTRPVLYSRSNVIVAMAVAAPLGAFMRRPFGPQTAHQAYAYANHEPVHSTSVSRSTRTRVDVPMVTTVVVVPVIPSAVSDNSQ